MKTQRCGWMRLWLPLALLLSFVLLPATSNAAFPGANGKIVYTVDDQLYTINPDGTNPVSLGVVGRTPAWSPDGRKIVFAVSGPDLISDIYVMNADGSNVMLLAENGDRPTWSPDGTIIAFTRWDPGLYINLLYFMNSDGSNAVVMGAAYDVDWSPDGAKLAYHDPHPVLLVWDLHQGSYTLLDVYGTSPDWSPDGSRIVYSCSQGMGRQQICIVNADGSNKVNVSNSGFSDSSPVWSPDGQKIVFTRADELYIMNADGSNQVQLTHGGASDPDWQPLRAAPLNCYHAYPSKALLWPANHKFVPIQVHGVIEPGGSRLTITIDSIFQDEAVDAPGSGGTSPDGKGVGTDTAKLRAERVRFGNGRVYHIGFTATNEQGGMCSGVVTVGVPRSRGQWHPIDEGPLYDSTLVVADVQDLTGASVELESESDSESGVIELLLPFTVR
jgi:TolB protein